MKQRAWAFVFDGHVFYVLNDVDGRTLVFDALTRQWHHWKTGESEDWSMHRGLVWRGRVIAVDDTSPAVLELSPAAVQDEGEVSIERTVSAFQPVRGRSCYRQGSLRLYVNAVLGAGDTEIAMRFSDDGGKTWGATYTRALEGLAKKRIMFRSLGMMKTPGRLWEIRDAGGLVRISGADADADPQQEEEE